MKRFWTLGCLGILLLGGVAAAQVDPNPDSICIYFEETETNCTQAPLGTIV